MQEVNQNSKVIPEVRCVYNLSKLHVQNDYIWKPISNAIKIHIEIEPNHTCCLKHIFEVVKHLMLRVENDLHEYYNYIQKVN